MLTRWNKKDKEVGKWHLWRETKRHIFLRSKDVTLKSCQGPGRHYTWLKQMWVPVLGWFAFRYLCLPFLALLCVRRIHPRGWMFSPGPKSADFLLGEVTVGTQRARWQTVRIRQQCGRLGFNPWVRKIPWRSKCQPTPLFSPGESPWTEEPVGLQSLGLQIVRHDSVINTATTTASPGTVASPSGSSTWSSHSPWASRTLSPFLSSHVVEAASCCVNLWFISQSPGFSPLLWSCVH